MSAAISVKYLTVSASLRNSTDTVDPKRFTCLKNSRRFVLAEILGAESVFLVGVNCEAISNSAMASEGDSPSRLSKTAPGMSWSASRILPKC